MPEWDKQEIEQMFGSQVEEVFNRYNTKKERLMCDINKQQQQHKLYLHEYNYVVTVLQKL